MRVIHFGLGVDTGARYPSLPYQLINSAAVPGIRIAAESCFWLRLKMAKPFAYSIWLVPSQPVRDLLAQLIGELARRFETPAFTPHATVCSGKWKGAVEDLKQIVDAVSSSLALVTLDASGIDCGDKRTTFFYLKLDNDRAQPLFAQFGRALPNSHPPQVGAHLSLMYAEPNAGIARKQLAGELTDRLPDRIEFDEVQLVTPVGAESSTDQWQTRHVRQLRDTA